MTYCDATARIMLVKPLFDEWKPLQDTPEGKVILKRRIMTKWSFQAETDGFWLLKKDGNRRKRVTVFETFVLRSNSTDWDACLTDEELEFVEKHWDYFVSLALAKFGEHPRQVLEDYITVVSKRIGNRNDYHVFGKKLTKESFTWPRVKVPWASNVECRDCANCGVKEGENDNHRRCNKCKVVFFCSRQCQKAHWRVHKKVCCKS